MLRVVWAATRKKGQAMKGGTMTELDIARAKWQAYEQNYILPLFGLAKEAGYDLAKAVLDNPGKTSSVLFVEHLQKEIAKLKQDHRTLGDEEVQYREAQNAKLEQAAYALRQSHRLECSAYHQIVGQGNGCVCAVVNHHELSRLEKENAALKAREAQR